jgi:hypothetical protein
MNNSAEVSGAVIGATTDVAALRRTISVTASVPDFTFGTAVLTRSSVTDSTFRLAVSYKNVGDREHCFEEWSPPSFSDGKRQFSAAMPLNAMGTIGTGRESSNYFIGCLRPGEIGYRFSMDVAAENGLTFDTITSVGFSSEPNELEFPEPPTRVLPVAYSWEPERLSIQIRNDGDFPASIDSPFPYVVLDDEGTVLYVGEVTPVCTGVLLPNESTWAVDRPFAWVSGGARVRAYVSFDRPDASGIDGRSAASCEPEPIARRLADETSEIMAMLADETSIHYTTLSGDLRAVPVGGGTPLTISKSSKASGPLAQADGRLYWATRDPSIAYVDDSGNQGVLTSSGLPAIASLAVASATPYFVSATVTPRLMSLQADGTLSTLVEAARLRNAIWADGSAVFYSANEPQGSGTYRLLLSTGEKTKLTDGHALGFSGVGTDVYWVEESYGIWRWSAVGGTQLVAAVTTFSTTTGFAADARGLYWVEGGDSGKLFFLASGTNMNRRLATQQEEPSLLALNSTSLFWRTGPQSIWGITKP